MRHVGENINLNKLDHSFSEKYQKVTFSRAESCRYKSVMEAYLGPCPTSMVELFSENSS